MATLIVLVIIVVLIGAPIVIYNRLVAARNGYRNAFAQIDVQLTRRYDLIPNLVETAKGYLAHERGTLEAVTAARNSALAGLKSAAADPGNPQALAQLSSAEGALGGALGRLFAVVEAYPDLKANQTMSQLMEELTSTENRVAFARQAYNDAVLTYNTAREVFPNNLVAGTFGFAPAAMLEIESPAKRAAPQVKFS
jgi:LemA protein